MAAFLAPITHLDLSSNSQYFGPEGSYSHEPLQYFAGIRVQNSGTVIANFTHFCVLECVSLCHKTKKRERLEMGLRSISHSLTTLSRPLNQLRRGLAPLSEPIPSTPRSSRFRRSKRTSPRCFFASGAMCTRCHESRTVI